MWFKWDDFISAIIVFGVICAIVGFVGISLVVYLFNHISITWVS